MNKLVLILALFISENCFSQDVFLGKSYNEVFTSGHKAYSMNYSGKKAICDVVDTNITDVYVFNNDICIEYDRLYSNSGLENLETYLTSEYFFKQNNIWVQQSKGLIAMITQLSDNFYKVSYRKQW